MTAEIRTEKIEDLLFCATKPVLEIKIEYPQIFGKIGGLCENRFNTYHLNTAAKINKYTRTEIYKKATAAYKNSEKTGFPFNFMIYERTVQVSCNNENIISLFSDTFQYEGGPHGMTARTSETRTTKDGSILPLGSFFIKGFHYVKYIQNEISTQITSDLETEDSVYYKNAPERSKRFFNEKRYYLSDTGFIFFYPSYSLAPYYAGIRLFEVPFENFGNKLKYIPQRMT